MNGGISITVITATLDAANALPGLIRSLEDQTDLAFTWVVVDGCSVDDTESLVRQVRGFQTRFLQGKDFGIYDALNRGVLSIQDGYYLVMGADDELEPDAIAKFRAAIATGQSPDFVAAAIRQDGRLLKPRRRMGWLYGMRGIASSHSVGLLIKRSLHEKYGLYSKKLPIAADQLFVKQAVADGASVFHVPFVAGTFGVRGTSGSDPLGVLTEVFRVQVRTEKYVLGQYLIFIARLAKLYISGLLRGSREAQ